MNKIIPFNINLQPEDPDKIIEIETSCRNGNPINTKEVEVLLKNLSYLVRKRIAEYEGERIEDYAYTYKCDLAQSIIYYYLKSLNIESNPVNTNEIMEGVCGHSLITATFKTKQGEKIYLIDPTYIQFFSRENCDPSKFVIINNRICISPDPGYFVIRSQSTKTLMTLLEEGYAELTEELAKAYGDSFFQTKQGIEPSQLKDYMASGSNYIRWFQSIKSKLSKKEEELSEMTLLINTNTDEKTNAL